MSAMEDDQEFPKDEERIGAQCGFCDGTGELWLSDPRGVGDDGCQCPYCYPYRAAGWAKGTVNPSHTTLPREKHLNKRWWQEASGDHSMSPTRPPPAPHLAASAPIYRPHLYPTPPKHKKQKAPPKREGYVRHFITHVTGERTRERRRWQRERLFMDVEYPIRKARYERREARRKAMLWWVEPLIAGGVRGIVIGVFLFGILLAIVMITMKMSDRDSQGLPLHFAHSRPIACPDMPQESFVASQGPDQCE